MGMLTNMKEDSSRLLRLPRCAYSMGMLTNMKEDSSAHHE
jgi:hypothetical protein